MKNPFLVSGYDGPMYFCDRERETQKIIEALTNNRNISLISPRRMGKTGLIQHVFYHLEKNDDNLKCFYIDIFSTQNLFELVTLLSKSILGKLDGYSESVLKRVSSFFMNLRPSFSLDPLTGMPEVSIGLEPSKAEYGLKELFNYMKESGKRCYIAIDEFQQITEYPEKGTEALLRSYIQFIPNVNFIFAGSKKHLMDAMFSSVNRPFYQSTQKLSLKEISMDSYSEFSLKLFKEADKNLDKEVFTYIYERMMGHTWYIQYVLNLLFSLNKNEYSTLDVEKIIAELIEEENATYKTYCEALPVGQLRVLKAVAKEKKVSSPYDAGFMKKYNLSALSSIKQALKALIDKAFILKDDDDSYYVYDRFFSIWLEK